MDRLSDLAARGNPFPPLSGHPETPAVAWPFALLDVTVSAERERGTPVSNVRRVAAATARSWGLPPPILT
jgi:hypothetical protein